MATVKNTIALQDKMTPVLRTIIKSLNSTMAVMAEIDGVSNKAFKQARRDINAATEAVNAFKNSADDVPSIARQGANAFSGWKNPLVTASALIYTIRSAVQALGGATDIADGFTLTNARLGLMNDGLQTTGQLQDMILASANRSRAEYDATASSVAKLGLLAGDAFKSTKETVAFAELLNKSFKVGGASIQEQTSGMYQLTQAMAAGKLQGDEFRSIMENAPMVADAIAKYMGKSKGELKQLSSDGVITADIIKNALFAASTDINSMFETLPMTWGDAWTQVKNNTLEQFQPVIEKLSEILNSEGFQSFLRDIQVGIGQAAQWVLNFIGMLQQLVSFIQENWEPIKSLIVGGLAAIAVGYAGAKVAALLYAFAQGAVNIELLVMNARLLGVMALVAGAVFLWNNFGIAGKVLAVILGVLAGVILVATIAQYAFNTSLWACPVVWIVAAIIAVIAIIVLLVMWIMDLWQNNMDFKYGIISIWNKILAFFDQVPIFFQSVWNAILDQMGVFKVVGLAILEAFINGAIDDINGFIDLLNKIPGVSIDTIGYVSFAADAAAEELAKKQARDADLADAKASAAEKAAAREAEADANRAEDEANLAKKKAEAEAKKKAAEEEKGSVPNAGADQGFNWDEFKVDGGYIDTVGKIDDDVSITDEDIKLLKDVAKTEFVNKYTTLTPNLHVQFGDVHETADTNELVAAVETMVIESLASSLD